MQQSKNEENGHSKPVKSHIVTNLNRLYKWKSENTQKLNFVAAQFPHSRLKDAITNWTLPNCLRAKRQEVYLQKPDQS